MVIFNRWLKIDGLKRRGGWAEKRKGEGER